MDWEERFDVHLKMYQIEEVAESLFEEQYRRWKPMVGSFRIRPEVDTPKSRCRVRRDRLS